MGTWHIIALNSNCAYVGGCSINSPQERWLKSDLAAHPAQCVLAFWHHPRFTSATGLRENLAVSAFWDDLYAAKADVVLNGHAHVYERFAPQNPSGQADPGGIREFIVGTGGQNHGTFSTTPRPTIEARDNTAYGVLSLTLMPSGYSWQFLSDGNSAFSDSGSADCS